MNKKITMELFRAVHARNQKIPLDLKKVDLPKKTLVSVKNFVRQSPTSAPVFHGVVHSGQFKNCPKSFTPDVRGFHCLVLTASVGGKILSYKSPLVEVA
ncbi:MAG: hypothetical protein L0Y72_07320 [Gemmataceae bacterium]|nr:hypothetical protein [Gemmataceae bacterium]MCI0738837.1 hypothetical protein [Gemmataceae bacterium]